MSARKFIQYAVLFLTLLAAAYVSVVAEFPANLALGIGLVVVNLAALRVFLPRSRRERSTELEPEVTEDNFVD